MAGLTVLAGFTILNQVHGQDPGGPIEINSANPSSAGSGGFGAAGAALPDLTGDGVGEFWLAAPYETVMRDVNGTPRNWLKAGHLYVYNGSTLGLLYTLESPEPAANRYFTWSADSAGDVNGDGIEDLMAGDPGAAGTAGKVHFYDGSTGKFLFSLPSPNPNSSLGSFGEFVQRLPDMTGDGHPDWLILQPEYQVSNGGRVYVFDSQSRMSVLTHRNTEVGYFPIRGGGISAVSDVDGDGKVDLLIGSAYVNAIRDGTTFARAGRVLVRSGATGQVLYELLDPDQAADRFFGEVLRGIGDVDGDQVGDLAIGSHWPDGEAGIGYLFSGKDGHWIRTLQPPNPAPSTWFGWDIEPLPDLNGDGKSEVWVNHMGRRMSYVFDGGSGRIVETLPDPDYTDGGSTILAIRQTAKPGIRAYLVGQDIQGEPGRAFVFPFAALRPVPRLRSLHLGTDGFHLQANAGPGLRLQIQATADFLSWETIGLVTTAQQSAEFVDDAAGVHGRRFYRFTEAP